MARVFYLHWNEEELSARIAPLRDAGHSVSCHWSTQATAHFGDALPEVVVISLDRLPSHGRAYAEWFQEAKKRRVIPLIFAGGKPDKVEAMRRRFPDATYCATEEAPAAVAAALAAAAEAAA